MPMTRDEFCGRLLHLPELISRMISPSRTAGTHQNLTNAGGMEFMDTAPFKPGDDLREFSAVLSERRGEDTRRINRDDRDLQVVILVDVRRSLSFGATRSKREFAIEIAGVLGLTALKTDDLASVAALALSKPFIKPRGDRNIHAYIAKLLGLLDIPPEKQEQSVVEVLRQAVALIPRYASVYVVSDWIYCEPDRSQPAAPLCTQTLYRATQDILGMLKASRLTGREIGLIAIHDTRDRTLPMAPYRVRSFGSGSVGVVDGTSLRQQEARNQLFAERQAWLDNLQHLGIDHCVLETDIGYEYLADLMTFFAKRRA